MILIYVLLILLLYIDCKPCLTINSFNDGYLSVDTCAIIKGFFVILVFLRHGIQYITCTKNLLNNLFFIVDSYSGQLIVAMFLFYSGYGIYESFKRKKEQYVKSFFVHRFIPTYCNFFICVFFYFLLSVAINEDYSIKRIILAFIGWDDIGNSNWYMFVTFVLYILFYICFNNCKSDFIKILIFSVLSFVLAVILYFVKPSYWYNTLLCFSLGLWWSYKKESIEKFLFFSKKNYYLAVLISIVCFIFLFFLSINISELYIILSCSFSISVCLFTMKIKINRIGCIFSLLGNHVFSIYILQRLFFIIFSRLGMNVYPYVFLSISFLAVITLSLFYDYVFNAVRKKITKLS